MSFASSLARRSCSVTPWPGQLNRYAPTRNCNLMSEWVCSINDHELLGELRSQLARVDFVYQSAHARSDLVHLLVARTDSPSLKIEIFANEHPPPHFRVKYGGETANYRISDCYQLNGDLLRYYRVIRDWHSKNKPKLIEYWNKLRPSNCPVGQYVES